LNWGEGFGPRQGKEGEKRGRSGEKNYRLVKDCGQKLKGKIVMGPVLGKE